MSNLMDYLDWRGDLTFREAPFNAVSYTHLDVYKRQD